MLSGKMEKDVCNVCRKESSMECEVCGDSYCGKECQRLDYKRHRYICFPLPALKPSERQECENCKRLSVECCDRCGFGYCSRKCQLLNWECHRYICAPMPKLIKKTRVAAGEQQQQPATVCDTKSVTTSTVSDFMDKFVNRKDALQKPSVTENKPREFSPERTRKDAPVFGAPKPTNNVGYKQDGYDKQRATDTKAMQQHRVPTTTHVQKSPADSSASTSPNTTTQMKQTNKTAKFHKAQENSLVRCMGFSSLNCIYMRNVSPENDKEFTDIIRKVNEFGKTRRIPLKLSQLHVTSTVLVNVDDHWYRGKVREHPENANNIPIRLIDLGEEVNSTITQVAGITAEINALPVYTYYLHLRNVPKVPLDEKMKNFVMEYVGATFKVKYNKPDKNGSTLELYPVGAQKTLNQTILEFLLEYNKDKIVGSDGDEKRGRAEDHPKNRNKNLNNSIGDERGERSEDNPKKPNKNLNNSFGNKVDDKKMNGRTEVPKASAASRETAENQKENTPPLGNRGPRVNSEMPFKLFTLKSDTKEMEVTVLDYSNISNGYFGCIPKELGVQLVDIQEFLSNIDDTEPYKPKLNEYCLALFEDEWYRAKCTKIEGPDSFKLLYIDFTNEETLSSKDIRKYPKDCKFDCNTFVCVLSNLPRNVTPKQIEFANDYFKKNNFVKLHNITCLEAPFYSADCYELVQ